MMNLNIEVHDLVSDTKKHHVNVVRVLSCNNAGACGALGSIIVPRPQTKNKLIDMRDFRMSRMSLKGSTYIKLTVTNVLSHSFLMVKLTEAT